MIPVVVSIPVLGLFPSGRGLVFTLRLVAVGGDGGGGGVAGGIMGGLFDTKRPGSLIVRFFGLLPFVRYPMPTQLAIPLSIVFMNALKSSILFI